MYPESVFLCFSIGLLYFDGLKVLSTPGLGASIFFYDQLNFDYVYVSGIMGHFARANLVNLFKRKTNKQKKKRKSLFSVCG